jgi:hypothetical protein
MQESVFGRQFAPLLNNSHLFQMIPFTMVELETVPQTLTDITLRTVHFVATVPVLRFPL